MVTLWAHIKKYWAYVVLVVGVIIGIAFFSRDRVNFADQLKKIQDNHDEEIKRIQEIREEELRQHLANERRLNDTLDVIKKQYDDAKKDLDDKKRKEIEGIVRQYASDPEGLATKLAEVTGFNVILPL
jgi:uncharacterized membrane-anchored protein YhcB (DUF1043 family)